MGDSFMSGLGSFSDSLSSIGDNLTSGFSSLSDGLNSNLDTGTAVKALPESSNLLQETSTNNPSNDSLFRQFRKNAGLSPDTPPKPKPVRTISAHNAFGNNRTDSGLPRPKPLPRAKAAPFNAMGDRTRPSLSDESLSSNRRLADSLAKSSDFTGIKRHIKPGLDKADPLAVAETHDLINQMNKASPGHGDKLAKELGLKAPKGSLTGGSKGDTLQSGKEQYVKPNVEIDDIQKAYKDLNYDPDGHGDLWNGVFSGNGLEANELSEKAEDATIKKYGRNGGNDESDAFRHAYWSYTMAEKFGQKGAKAIGDGHESNPKGSYSNDHEKKPGIDFMDLHNNRAGRELFEQYGKSGRPPEDIISDAIRADKLQLRPFKIRRIK